VQKLSAIASIAALLISVVTGIVVFTFNAGAEKNRYDEIKIVIDGLKKGDMHATIPNSWVKIAEEIKRSKDGDQAYQLVTAIMTGKEFSLPKDTWRRIAEGTKDHIPKFEQIDLNKVQIVFDLVRGFPKDFSNENEGAEIFNSDSYPLCTLSQVNVFRNGGCTVAYDILSRTWVVKSSVRVQPAREQQRCTVACYTARLIVP
jgi:hypothetical protein